VVTPETEPRPRRWTRQDGALRDRGAPGPGRDLHHTRVAPRASADRGGLDACESPGLMRRWNDGAGYPAPPGLHAQRGAQRGDHFEDHRRGSRCCPGVAAPPAGGVLFPVVYHGRDSGQGPRLFTGSPPARLTSRSGRGMDGRQARGLSIWAPAPGREPP